ncbi:MAG: hypothetical protein K9N38_04930 [Candidatus Marinimicrobia bacterium]|nr:hypothetical protein [Candidatus Neomarinimicrobiota bacterium]MCF7851001.1 hypothetical protein [Candidatus Neomarinimicrobiota bacterium]
MNQRIITLVLLAVITILPVHAETLTVAVIRVSFQADDSPATAGDGAFIMKDESGIDCSEWVLDPPPHNSTYFQDHIKAASNYWERVSAGSVEVDTVNSAVFPSHPDSAYRLSHDMLNYQPYLEEFDETAKLMELARDAIELADPDVDFNQFTTVIVAHAGMGGDFAFALDPTPGNIPTAYLSQTDFNTYGSISTTEKVLNDLIIIPESQNFMQYDETRALFEDSDDPCFYQVGLNGTIALMLGFHLGLPPMYDTETGQSLVGGFALMDQGSNNYHGIVPAFPNPYTRVSRGWTSAVERSIGDDVSVHVDDPPVKILISDSEYYLIENRQRNILDPAGMETWIDTLVGDTVSVITGTSGVVVAVDEQHAGLPGNGLYIWHIDEAAEYTSDNPNGGIHQLVDFIEADGAQDMGHESQLIFADHLETGWWFDTWFAENEGWHHLNREQDAIHLSSRTYPSTKTNAGQDTYLRIENISARGSTMSFSIRSDRRLNSDQIGKFIGWGKDDTTLWAFNSDYSQILEYDLVSQDLVISDTSTVSPNSILNVNADSSFLFRYPWLAPRNTENITLYHISSGSSLVSDVDSLFEISFFRNSGSVFYYGKQDGGYVSVFHNLGQTTITPLNSHPITNFGLPSAGYTYYYPGTSSPAPVSVFNDKTRERDIIAWSPQDHWLDITSSEGIAQSAVAVDKPIHVIPCDVENDGYYELALFYHDQIRIVNQSGVDMYGTPFSVDPYYGNPIIAPIFNGKPGIFVRHYDSFSVYSLAGQIQDRGLMPVISGDIQNTTRHNARMNYVLSGEDLLYFPYTDMTAYSHFWIEPQGNKTGTRVVSLYDFPVDSEQSIGKKSVFNYPNPVKGQSTTIRAWLGDVDEWSIEIFSINGSQVAYEELDVEQQNAYNEWVWDASAVSNGVFMVQVVAGDMAEIFKIAVIR